MPSQRELSLEEFRSGLKAPLPLVIGVFSFGLAYGILAIQAGLSFLESTLMSLTVFAGAAQFVATGMLMSVWSIADSGNGIHDKLSTLLDERVVGSICTWLEAEVESSSVLSVGRRNLRYDDVTLLQECSQQVLSARCRSQRVCGLVAEFDRWGHARAVCREPSSLGP